jgi:hypothetical protein
VIKFKSELGFAVETALSVEDVEASLAYARGHLLPQGHLIHSIELHLTLGFHHQVLELHHALAHQGVYQ